MKVALSLKENSEDSQIEKRFGRCPYFMIYDTESEKTEIVDNENQSAKGGAGIQTAQMLSNHDVQVVVTGNVGPNAFRTLESADIEVYNFEGYAKTAIERYKEGKLEKVESQTVKSHFGQSK